MWLIQLFKNEDCFIKLFPNLMSSYAVSDSVPGAGRTKPMRCLRSQGACSVRRRAGEGSTRNWPEAVCTPPLPCRSSSYKAARGRSSTASYLQAPPMSGAWLFAGWGFPCSSICYTVVDTCWCCCRLSSLQCAFICFCFVFNTRVERTVIFFCNTISISDGNA